MPRVRVFLTVLFCGVFLLVLLAYRATVLEGSSDNRDSSIAFGPVSRPAKLPSYDDDSMLIFYNRLPKTGSTSFINIAYSLVKKNRFHAYHLNVSRNRHTLSVVDQKLLLHNITNWLDRRPAIVHGHVAFINFQKFGYSQISYINIVRDPIERLVSYYYFVRYGDDYRPNLVRKKFGDTRTFDECVADDSDNDCSADKMWLQIPFFCGQVEECWEPGSSWALTEAKRNLVEHYVLVGVTEQMGDFVAVLEAVYPRFFRGALDRYLSNEEKSHMRKTVKKIPPSEATLSKLKESKVWQYENHFYEFAKTQFDFVKAQVLRGDASNNYGRRGSRYLPLGFHFEKVKPKFESFDDAFR